MSRPVEAQFGKITHAGIYKKFTCRQVVHLLG